MPLFIFLFSALTFSPSAQADLRSCMYKIDSSTYSLNRKQQMKFCKQVVNEDEGFRCLYSADSGTYRLTSDQRVNLCATTENSSETLKCIYDNASTFGKERDDLIESCGSLSVGRRHRDDNNSKKDCHKKGCSAPCPISNEESDDQPTTPKDEEEA